MNRKNTIVTGTFALLGLGAAPALAQTDALFITNPNAGTLHRLQGGTMSTKSQKSGVESPIAIIKDVRTRGPLASGGGMTKCYSYDLAGAYTGTFSSFASIADLHDGATDGKYFYSVSPSGKAVHQYDTYWGATKGSGSGGRGIFVLPDGGWGITWDDVDKAFWVSVPSTGTLNEYSPKGQLLRTLPYGWGKTALAWEPSTDTLWAVDNFGGNVARQIRKDGTTGLTVPLGFTMMSSGGAEFAIPAPGSALLAAAGLLAAARRKR